MSAEDESKTGGGRKRVGTSAREFLDFCLLYLCEQSLPQLRMSVTTVRDTTCRTATVPAAQRVDPSLTPHLACLPRNVASRK